MVISIVYKCYFCSEKIFKNKYATAFILWTKHHLTSIFIPYLQSEKKWLKITEKFSRFELKANTVLLDKNVISTKTYFLEKGYVRSYILNEDNEEITTNIYTAPCFVNDFLSFFRQQPTKEIYQTVTDCVFWETGLENVQHNFHNIPEFREFSRLLFVLNYYNIHDRLIEMASQKASTRYASLMKKDPEIFRYVPLKVIASYLGIKDSSLSRIRRDIYKI